SPDTSSRGSALIGRSPAALAGRPAPPGLGSGAPARPASVGPRARARRTGARADRAGVARLVVVGSVVLGRVVVGRVRGLVCLVGVGRAVLVVAVVVAVAGARAGR